MPKYGLRNVVSQTDFFRQERWDGNPLTFIKAIKRPSGARPVTVLFQVVNHHQVEGTRAMRAMEQIHQEWSWVIVLVGVVTMVSGLVLLIRELLPRTALAMRRICRTWLVRAE